MATMTHGNPYTHEEHIRESKSNADRRAGCDWCGSTPRVLYQYDRFRGWFCNLTCFRPYHLR